MTNRIALGDSAADNEFLQLAQSLKYSSEHRCIIAELRPGLFALYQHAQVLYVGDSIEELIDAYRARPKWTSPLPRSRQTRCEKTSAAERAANTARLLATLAGAKI